MPWWGMDIERLARAQHGVLTRAQALSELTREQVRWRLTSGRWKRIAPGIYQIHTGATDWLTRAAAALLHAGEGAALTLRSAAHVHGFVSRPPQVITIAIPGARRVRRIPGVRITRRSRLPTVQRRGLAVTTVAATVLDLAAEPGITATEAIAWAADACRDTSCTAAELADELRARRAHPHRRHLRMALGVIDAGAQSVLEVGFVRGVLRRHGLPEMAMQVPAQLGAASIRRDFESQVYRLVVEVDGVIGHDGSGVDRDRLRDRRSLRQGRITVRAGWVDVDLEPCELALDLCGALRQRGWRGEITACGPRCAVTRSGRASS